MTQVTWTSSAWQKPNWAAEELAPMKLLPGGARINAADFNFSDGQTVTLAAGVVAAGSNKTLTLTAPLLNDIPAGYILNFGDGEFATLTVTAKKGESAITGVTLAAALEGGESASFAGVSGRKPVDSGILVGRTYAERDAGTAFGLADVTTPDDEIYLIAFGTPDAIVCADVTLLRHHTLVYEDKLPNWASLSAGQKAAIRARYTCIKSAA
jgi:hypothetical protein